MKAIQSIYPGFHVLRLHRNRILAKIYSKFAEILKLVDFASADQDPRGRYNLLKYIQNLPNSSIQISGPENIQHNGNAVGLRKKQVIPHL